MRQAEPGGPPSPGNPRAMGGGCKPRRVHVGSDVSPYTATFKLELRFQLR